MSTLFVVAAALFIYLALMDSRYFHKGRHCGEYVEPETESNGSAWLPWRMTDEGHFIWEGSVITNAVSDSDAPTYGYVTVYPQDGIVTVPPLIGECGPSVDDDHIRDLINNELASAPVYTALKFEDYGRFGDSDFDRVDASDLRLTTKTWIPEDE